MMFNEIPADHGPVLKKLNLPEISQIGVVVPDLNKAARFYRNVLNVKNWYRTKINSMDCIYRDKSIELPLDIAVGYSGKTQIELIKLQNKVDNIYNEVLGHGRYGFHHLGVMVGNIDKRLRLLEKAGILPLQSGTIRTGKGGVTKFAYLDTLETAGFILELIETRAFGIPLGMPRWLVSVGRMTGDTELMK